MASQHLPDKTFFVQHSSNPILFRYAETASIEPALDPRSGYIEEIIDFNHYLQPNLSSTFLIRFKGDSMKEANIPDNALLVVDRSIQPVSNMIVLAVINKEFTVKRYIKNSSGIRLMPSNPRYPPHTYYRRVGI
jgi:DNA polymerase V